MTWGLLGWDGPPSVWFVHGDAPLVVRWWATNDSDETAFPNGYSYVVLPQPSDRISHRESAQGHFMNGLRDRKRPSSFGSDLMVARFKAKVKIDFQTGCHEWQGCRHSNGYGQIRCEGVVEGTHRVAWRLEIGEIPDGLHVLHKCDNRRCVNVTHMFLGTQADNIADRMKKGRKKGVGKQFKPWRPVPEWRQPW